MATILERFYSLVVEVLDAMIDAPASTAGYMVLLCHTYFKSSSQKILPWPGTCII